MKHSIRQQWLALSVVIVAAAAVAACGQITNSEEAAQPAAKARAAPGMASVSAADASACDDPTAPTCTPTGAHAKHPTDCTTCHFVAGRVAFRPTGAGSAYPSGWVTGQPRPTFDATTKTCSNVACHGVPAGTYTYWVPGNEDLDGDGYPDAELKIVSYGGTMSSGTPSWYTTGSATCTACHGNPPRNGSNGSNAWHSGNHANSANFNVGGGLVLNANQCELCHNVLNGSVYSPIATSAFDGTGWRGTVIVPPSYHGNGLNVAPRWRTACFGCH